jgi:hypothetical protein
MKNSINDNPKLAGKESQLKFYTDAVINDTFFPRGVHIVDIDRSVRDEILEKFQIVSQGNKIPFLDIFSIERYSEFIKTWKSVDSERVIKMPFMVLVKEPTQKGTNMGGTYNIPALPTFPLWKRNVVRNGRATVDYYQIPQPVNIDVPYTLHIFTTHLRELNMVDEMMLHKFRESQYYIVVNGHHMPLKFEGMDDQSEIGDIESRRYYHKAYSLNLRGYLLNEEEFKKLPSIDSIKIKVENSVVKNSSLCEVKNVDLDCDLCLHFKFNRKSPSTQTVRVPADLEFYYDNQGVGDYSYFLNNNLVNLPFVAEKGDELTVAHNMGNAKVININVCGRKL